MSQQHLHESAEKKKFRINPRNIPFQIAFWSFLIFLFYLFFKALAH